MIKTDEEALICDFAETYHIYNYRALPARYAATLAVGLRGTSRIRRKMLGLKKMPSSDLMQVMSIDTQRRIFWLLSRYMGSDMSEPSMLWDVIFDRDATPEATHGYATIEEYEAAKRRILKGAEK